MSDPSPNLLEMLRDLVEASLVSPPGAFDDGSAYASAVAGATEALISIMERRSRVRSNKKEKQD